MEASARFSIGRVTRFYFPLLLQGFSQSLTYPLVAGVVTSGVMGANVLPAFSQGLMIMFMIGALGGGLVTTGLVFAKTRLGYDSFTRLNNVMAFVLISVQAVAAMPPFDAWIFEGFFNLPSELAVVARRMLLFGTVMNFGFFVRNLPLVVLFNHYESGKANLGTFIRILVTLGMSVLLPRFDCVGPDWGLFALTVGVWVETAITWFFARPYVAKLPNPSPGSDPPDAQALLTEQFRFTIPLALGGFLLACAPLVIAAFVARSVDGMNMLNIHYVTIWMVNPFAFAALRLQTVAVKFTPEYKGDRRLLWYSFAAGLLLGLVPLVVSTPLLSRLYFCGYQHLSASLLPTARLALCSYAFICMIQAIRAYTEGLAAAAKESKAVMYGQIAYTLSLFLTCAILLPLRVPGWLIAVAAINVAPVCVTATIRLTRRK